MKRDIDRIKEEADVDAVLHQMGIPVVKRGAYYFLHCPCPDHADEHATNCYYKDGWTGVYCEVCQRQFHAIDIIMFATGMDFLDACDTLWDICGRPDWYWDNTNVQTSFRLTREDAELIGIKMPGTVLVPFRLTDRKEKLPEGYRYTKKYIGTEKDGFLACKAESIRWWDMMSEKEFAELVCRKADEKKENLSALKNEVLQFSDRSKIDLRELLRECDHLIQECARVFSGAERFLQGKAVA